MSLRVSTPGQKLLFANRFARSRSNESFDRSTFLSTGQATVLDSSEAWMVPRHTTTGGTISCQHPYIPQGETIMPTSRTTATPTPSRRPTPTPVVKPPLRPQSARKLIQPIPADGKSVTSKEPSSSAELFTAPASQSSTLPTQSGLARRQPSPRAGLPSFPKAR